MFVDPEKWHRVQESSCFKDNCPSKDPELIDQGTQPKSVPLMGRSKPQMSSVDPRDIGHFSDNGVTKTRGGGDVPGVTDQGTYAEAEPVVGGIEKDLLDDLLREHGG